MSRPRLPLPTIVSAGATAVLVGFALAWVRVSHSQIALSDFTNTYVGGTLLREGHGAHLYDAALQTRLHSALIAPLREGNLPFVNPPPAALLATPFTLLHLDTAYRLWQVMQLGFLAAAAVIVARFAPWPGGTRRRVLIAAVLTALAGMGTLSVGLLGQWDGFSALGLAIAYALWRRDRLLAGGAVLAVSAAAAKPHLALGLFALVAGWRNRRVLAGAAAGLAAVALLSLAMVGTSGASGFLEAARADAVDFPLTSTLGFTGLTGSWLGNGVAAQSAAAVGTVLALALCVAIGNRLHREPSLLEPCLAAATMLSLLASPHTLGHDLALLTPVLVALLAFTTAREPGAAWPGAASRAVVGGWLLLALAAALDLGSQGSAPPGRLVPLALIGGAALLVLRMRPREPAPGAAPGPLRPRPAS